MPRKFYKSRKYNRRLRRTMRIVKYNPSNRGYLKSRMINSRARPAIMTHAFKRSLVVSSGVSTGSGIGAGIYYGVLSPQLNQMANVSEFGALYDAYKINYVVYRVVWRSTNISTFETANNQNIGAPYLLWVLDRDDSLVPTTTNMLREYANCKEFVFTPDRRECYIKWKPSTLTQVYQSNIATSYNIQFGKYIDIADGGATPHYGVKFAIVEPNGGSPTAGQIFDIFATFYFTMKCPR